MKVNQVDAKRKGLRIALAIAVGFTWATLSGAIVPFLGPMFAAQFLIGSARPLTLSTSLGNGVLVLTTGVVMQFITMSIGDRPPALLMILGFFYFICFFLRAKGKGGGAVFLILIVAVVVPLMTILNPVVGNAIVAILVHAVVTGTLLMWLAHALIPDRSRIDAQAAAVASHPLAVRFAVANTVILLVAFLACLTVDGLETAAVIPITVASLLSQFEVAGTTRAAIGLVMVNLLGGLVASAAFVLLQVHPTPTFLFLIVFLAGLIFGGRAALEDRNAKVYAGALMTFLIVFGLGVSPLPGSAAETFSTRVNYILVAVGYTIFMAALLWPQSTRENAVRQDTSR